MDPNSIPLESISKLFEYEKIARDIDSINDIEIIKNFAKLYAKLYLKQQEVVSKL
ncbi:MAG: hypothetical protein ACO3UU_16810 [Minisyncoccia bacterium]